MAIQHKMYPVFVDNIANDVRTADLRAVFNRHGDVVEVTIVSDHGFVIFGNPDDALEAIRKVNGQELNGKQLSVDVSKELEDYLHGNKEHSDETRRHRSNGSFEQDRFRGGRGGRDRGRRGWNYRGGRARGFRGRVRRGYGRFSPTSRNERRSRSPREDSYQYQQQRNHSPTSRRYSVGDEKRRSFSPMVKTYPPPDGDNRYHHFKGNRGSRGKPKASPPRRGQNIFPSRESRSPSARRSPSRSRTGSPPRHDSSHHSNARKRSRGTQSRSRSPSREDRGRRASEITKPSRHSLESASDSNKGSKMDNFGFFTASNFVETKIEKPKSPLQPLPATSPITSTSANDTTSTSATNDDEVERGEHRKETSSSTHKINNSSSPYHLNSNQQKEDTKIPATMENNEKSNKDKPSNKSSPSPDKQVDLRELLKSKKKKDKSRSIDAAFDSPPVKRKKSSSTSSSLKNRTNIQIKVERESESVRTIMVGAKQKSKQIKVFEENEIKSELDMTQKSELPPPSARAGMPPTILPASESIKTEKLDMEKHEKLFVGNLFNPVENEDIELLFDEFGPIKQIKRYEKHAIVTIECSAERADEACKALDHNNWMDNWIRVKKNKYLHSKEEADAIYKSKQSAGERNMNRWYSQHDNRDQITLFREDDEDELTYRDRNPSSESTGIQEEREPKKPKPTSTKAELDTMFINSFSKSELEDNAKDDNMENRCENADTNASPDAENTKDPEEVELAEKLKKRKSMERKVRSFKIYCATSNKNFMSDIVEVFTRFGAVKSNDWDGPCIAIDLESTEKKAVQCIFETNKIRYKGQELRVKFKDGTEEDKAEFHEIYEVEFRNYPKDLVPTNASQIRSAMTATEIKQSSKKTDELPIGVLPQSNSLGAFGTPGIPDQGMLTSILQKARENMIKSDNASNTNSPNLSIAATKAEPLYNAYAIATGPLMTKDPQYLSEVEGNVHSVNSRIVLIQFHTGSSWRLAKLSPGTMYVDGKKCLGSLINNNSFHSWPKALKHFLYQGAKVKMDVKRMYNEEDIAEVKELCGEHVTYSTPLVWKINTSKPTEKDITISRVKQKSAVLKGSVTSIYPKWGVIKTSKGEVFFEVNHVYIDNKKLSKQVSLLNHIEKGDTLAVQCVEVPDYLEMSEIARSAPGFAGRTDTLKYHARLVWHLNAEVDPYSVRNCESSEFSDIDCNFLTTSTTLNKPLPSDRDILSRPTKGWTGRVEEIHLPAGGVILLDENLNLKPYERYAYFHRSRLYANGSKISSSKSLDDEIVPGDRVTVDVVENMQPGVINKSNAYVASEAYWVALSVHLNSIGRGNAIARSLKMEVDYMQNPSLQETPETCSKPLFVNNSFFRGSKTFLVVVQLLPVNGYIISKSSYNFVSCFSMIHKSFLKLYISAFVITSEVSCLPLDHPFPKTDNNIWGTVFSLKQCLYALHKLCKYFPSRD